MRSGYPVKKPRLPRNSSARRNAKLRRGAALMEFSISIPVMLLLSIAVFDFAKTSYFRFVVADAAGAASRYAAFNPVTTTSLSSWTTELESAARNSVQGSPWISQNDLVIKSPIIEQISSVEKRITVRVEYVYHLKLWWPGLPSQASVSSQVVVVAPD
jgi:uncharacterized protein (UPF0333 family)